MKNKKKTSPAKKKQQEKAKEQKKEEIISSLVDPVFRSEYVEADMEEKSADINYEALQELKTVKREFDEEEIKHAKNVVFYCKECKEIVKTKRKKGKKVKFICENCQGSSIYLGSELGIRSYFHIK